MTTIDRKVKGDKYKQMTYRKEDILFNESFMHLVHSSNLDNNCFFF
jgi:hypothetical protein